MSRASRLKGRRGRMIAASKLPVTRDATLVTFHLDKRGEKDGRMVLRTKGNP